MIAADAVEQDFALRHVLRPAIIRSSVDLPHPEGPTKTVNEQSSRPRWTRGGTASIPGGVRGKHLLKLHGERYDRWLLTRNWLAAEQPG